MKKLVLTAMAVASAGMLFAQSSWTLGNSTVTYDLTSGTGVDPKVRTGNSLDLMSTPTTSEYLPCPTDGIVNVFTSSMGGTFELDEPNAALTFSNSKSTSYMNRFSMYNLTNASPLTKLSFKVSFNDNLTNYEEWVLTLGNKQMGSDSVFTKTNFITNTKPYYEVFNTFKWVVTNAVSGDKTITLQYRRKNTPTSVQSYVDISSSAFEQGKNYDVEVVCNNSDQTQTFVLGGNTIAIDSRRTMLIVDNNIVSVATLPSAAKDDQIYSNVMPVNTPINSFAFSGLATGANTATETDSEITLSNISWNYVLPSVLPVSFMSFTGKGTNDGVLLTWQTASEKSNAHFEIYRSQDGVNFSKIGSIAGAIDTYQKSNYSFIDKYPFSGVNYYKLTQVDTDGNGSAYDQLVSVDSDLSNDVFSVSLSPEKVINVSVSSIKNKVVKVRLTDVSGKVLYAANETLISGINQIQLPATTLISGVYLVSVVYENATIKTAKIIL